MTQHKRQVDPALLEILIPASGLRVWSVIVTIFGDSVLPRGGTAPASMLTTVCTAMGLQPGAVRVALHRLVKDGWILRSVHGRKSYYRLSEERQDEFTRAAGRIYASRAPVSTDWLVAIAPSHNPEAAANLERQDWIRLAGNVYLGSGPRQAPEDCDLLIASGGAAALPDWARAATAPDGLKADFEDLRDRLQKLEQGLREAPAIDPLDAVVLRTLIVHHWRRLLLRQPDLPDTFLPRDWPAAACRQLVLGLHERLSGPADSWLDQHVGEPVKGRVSA